MLLIIHDNEDPLPTVISIVNYNMRIYYSPSGPRVNIINTDNQIQIHLSTLNRIEFYEGSDYKQLNLNEKSGEEKGKAIQQMLINYLIHKEKENGIKEKIRRPDYVKRQSF